MNQMIEVNSLENISDLVDCIDDVLYWNKDISRSRKSGRQAAHIDGGYRIIYYFGKRYKEHRVIFYKNHGYCPDFVDHIDGNLLNNRIENLRPATIQQNVFNAKTPSTSKTGVKGVTTCPKTGKYIVRIGLNNSKIWGGRFNSFEDAKNVAMRIRLDLHGEYARSI